MHADTTKDPGPRRRDPEARRRAILEAAAEIIVERGSAALTHRAVAARAKVALGSTTRYFASINDLREATLRMLGDEIDATVDVIERELSSCDDPAERCAALMFDYLLDSRQVHATMALVTAATSDAGLRSLAHRWTDRLTDVLARHASRERAVAVQIYLDGATMHAALHDNPLSREELTHVIRALLAMPETEGQ